MERDTVGKLSAELLQQDVHGDHSVGEQMHEQLGDYEKNILDCIDRGKTDFPGDFYIVVITKREKLMPNVLRHYFFPRISCPTPDYDQVLYKYYHSDDRIELVWVVPDKYACADLKANAINLDPQLTDLLQFVLDFSDGTLDKKARALNGEIIV
jgi:hypothetical protein